VLEALSGLLYITGDITREPLKVGGNPAYYMTAVHAFSGVMGAILHAEDTGIGQHMDISIVQGMAMNSMMSSLSYELTGRIMQRMGDRTPVHKVKDGYLGLMLRPDAWSQLCQLLDRPDLQTDPRFIDGPARQEHMAELNKELAIAVSTWDKTELYHRAQKVRIPAGYVCTAPDLLESPQYQYREFFQNIDHPHTGRLTYPGIPWKMDTLPLVIGRAPLLGEHNGEIYGDELGLTESEIESLTNEGTI
jgi:crotonobetainyl-CoA:carnitine CoA-transferase CaiB-like acyl-CoA transferase